MKSSTRGTGDGEEGTLRTASEYSYAGSLSNHGRYPRNAGQAMGRCSCFLRKAVVSFSLHGFDHDLTSVSGVRYHVCAGDDAVVSLRQRFFERVSVEIEGIII